MKSLSPNRIAQILAVAFVLPGILGFFPNPVIGPDGLFAANTAHNLVHLVTAALFLFMSTQSASAARRFTQVFGVIYLLVGVMGFLVLGGSEEGMLLGVVHINQLDNFLHIGLGVLICVAGFAFPKAPAS
ncbi:MAG: DUF4383 domain-containing protein [Deltaproteobacteria bacterium]|nr:DUF4383 domain-containing protein [Deltaproteobacteria bacterium]